MNFELQSTLRQFIYATLKRAFDIIFSFVALTLFCVPGIIIAVAIRLSERRPVLFFQERIGKDRKPFYIVKFRTMIDGQPTRIGKVLRATGIDEWPQFINVLSGEMSIVGPRALTKADIMRLGWDHPYYDSRWSVKPGITGLAQLYGGQHKKASWFWDSQYLTSQNLFIDTCAIVLSFLMNIFGKRRVRRILFQRNHLR